LFRICI